MVYSQYTHSDDNHQVTYYTTISSIPIISQEYFVLLHLRLICNEVWHNATDIK